MANFDGNNSSGLKDKLKGLKSVYDKEGLSGIERQLKERLNGWKDVHIKIAVIGRSGTGKSSFINAIRGITADDTDDNPAEVDVKECTTKVKEYIYPYNNNLRIYDLPGLGTENFPKSTYLADVNFEQYDFCITLTASRFTTEDLWLAQQAEEKGKPFYFVRSKIDNDVRDQRRSHPKTHNEDALLNVIKEDLQSNLKMLSRTNIFLIDNYEKDLYDFGRLTSKLMGDSKEIKENALALSLTCVSNEVIAEKKRILQQDIPIVSFWAALSIEPSPHGTQYGKLNASFVSEEVKRYGEQFQVDISSVTLAVEICGLSENEKKNVDDKTVPDYKAGSEILTQSLLDIFALIPIAGNLAGGLKCANYLEKKLDETAEKAKEIHGLMTKGLAKKLT